MSAHDNEQGFELVGVYEEGDARRAAQAAGEAGAEVRVGDPRDRRTALRGEMRDELANTVAGPGVGPFTKEMTKGIVVMVAAGTVVGAVVMFVVGWLFADFANLGRLASAFVCAAIGAAGGATFGFVAGGAGAAKGPVEPLAAERGTTVAVRGRGLAALEGMEEAGPIRLDAAAADGTPVAAVDAEEDEGAVHTLAERAHQTEGDWSRVGGRDDLHER